MYFSKWAISKLSLFLRIVKFTKWEFFAGVLISNIKYNYLEWQNENFFYLFYYQLDYILAHWFVKFEIKKDNVDKFWFELLMNPLT